MFLYPEYSHHLVQPPPPPKKKIVGNAVFECYKVSRGPSTLPQRGTSKNKKKIRRPWRARQPIGAARWAVWELVDEEEVNPEFEFSHNDESEQ